ncbi:MAG: CRISPR-associated helicase Cas3' [Moraxellaceae bacterium]|nr:CRISPR-associated helicase Cas3' [Moraxellaceae bacterium]
MDSYFRYWGKAQKESGNEGPEYHLLPFHCLDVAAVGYEYLSLHGRLSQFFCDEMGCNREDWLNWAAFWLALHDLGKFSEAFQSQRPDIFIELQALAPNPSKAYTERHDSLGQWLWVDRLSSLASEECWFGAANHAGLDAWMRSVTGHHGQPPKASQYSASDDHFCKKDRKAVVEFIGQIRDLFTVPTIPSGREKQFEKASGQLSWWFAGVAVLSDWLGSNTDFFPYRSTEIPLAEYWQLSREQARTALQASGVIPGDIKPSIQFAELFPEIGTPSPLQSWAMTVDIGSTAQIFLLEDVTGAGKTEAALSLAYRLMGAGNADGFFVALPTMATANAMYDRVSTVYNRLFKGNANIALAHGSRNMVEEFAKTIIHASKAENDDAQSDQTATARCTAWLSDHSKRALLAQAGVGTIDQALLGVLHSKHQSLRLLGLFGKVLIVDEVHACDAYMQGVLEILLEFHARAGGSAILLSATLPVRMKQALLAAYAKGRQASVPDIVAQAYPLVTMWRSNRPDCLDETPLKTRSAVSREVGVAYQSDLDVVISEIENTLANGQCACWVRNTVADAMDAFAIFAAVLPPESITLFHARFTLHDRLEKEDYVLTHFGKHSTNEQRQGRLVIATQVIEQSLDVDFDLLVSDLAPIDRLLQRAGRLRRHTREASGNRILEEGVSDQRGMPVLHVYAPAWGENPPADWLKRFLPKASFVYPHHAQLWLTAKALQKGVIAMPGDARTLIESVFGAESDIPEELQKNFLTVEGQQMAEASQAKNNTLTFAGGYRRGDVLDWWSEAKTPSRLGEASVNVVLARWEGGRLVPWVQRQHAWAYSTVRIAERLIAEVDIPAGIRHEFQRALETLPGQGKWSILLPLTET